MVHPPAFPASTPIPPTDPIPTAEPTIHLPHNTPIVTYSLLGLSILVFIAQMITESTYGNDIPLILGAKINEYIRGGEYWRFVSPALLHASLTHIGFNMYALFSIGPGLERYYGHTRFFGLYLISAIGGNVMSFLMSPNISVGASTAIFGLVAAEGMFIYLNRKLFGAQARSMLTNIAVIILINLGLGFSPGIDNWGHLGGLLTGLAFAGLAGPVLEVQFDSGGYTLVDERSGARALVVGIGLLVVWAFFAAAGLVN